MTEPTKQEIWMPIAEGIGYEVSDQGNVRSLRVRGQRTVPDNPTPHLIYSYVYRNGYRKVNLSYEGKKLPRWVHRLVLQAFVGPCPEGMEVRHLDGDPSNNALRNLAYGTHSENMQDALRHGTQNMVRKTHCKRGHEFTPENTFIRQDTPETTPRRVCRECHRWHGRKNYAKAKVLDTKNNRRASVSNT